MNTLEQLKAEQKNLANEMNKLKAEMCAKSKELLYQEFREFFTKYDGIVSTIAWRQYTDYFNDGEPCDFHVHDTYLWLVGDDDSNDYEGSEVPAEADIAYYEKLLEEVLRFEADPQAWLDKKNQEYIVRGYSYNPYNSSSRPSSYSSDELKWKIARAKAFIETHPELEADFNAAKQTISNIDSDLMYDMFGDHANVIVSKRGIVVEEYTNHD